MDELSDFHKEQIEQLKGVFKRVERHGLRGEIYTSETIEQIYKDILKKYGQVFEGLAKS